jgi:hypothetical protein
MTKKMIDVEELVNNMRRAGMKAGIGFDGASSYHIISLAGGLEVWGYIPGELPVEEDGLLGPDVISKLAGN